MTVDPSSPSRPLDPRVRLAALWTSVMFLVAFVDIFAFYRADLREQIEAGRAFVFTINEAFMLGIVLYVAVPSLMVAASALIPRRVNRLMQIVVAAVFALTIIGAAIGEWSYYLVASGIELALLAGVIAVAVRWKDTPLVAARDLAAARTSRDARG
ncbi:MAG: hypothetical protein IE924_03980 [Microbacterium sp.]|uniref:DUF6326 family protein n=1 Tax=Microbacterium sp. TaxID=51671 RepID=UPI0019908567|nr:DUF6326 family protein [Microbacterium sp.]MBD3757243.1 hypothetical protein [Microbacterium sp.]